MHKSVIFIVLALAFCGGILLVSLFRIENLYIFLILIFAVFALPICYIKFRRSVIFILAVIFLCFGAYRMNLSHVPNAFVDILNSKQEFEAIIIEEPDLRETRQLVTIKPLGYSQRILVTSSLYGNFNYGDLVLVRGKLNLAKNFDDFNYQGYLERFNVYAVMSYPKIIVLKNNQASLIKRTILGIKKKFIYQVENILEKPKSSLLLGILIGAKNSLPKDLTENFRITGISHIVAVSGYNITIIILALEKLSLVLGRKLSTIFSTLFILSFVVIAGASGSVVRAGMMGGILLLSFSIGRLYVITPSFVLAGFVMLLINPKILFYDVGFQLSFAATWGIVYLLPEFERVFQRVPKFFNLKSIFLATMSAIIATLPFLLLYFEKLSLVAPIVNLLVLPMIPLTMLLGFLSAIPVIGFGFAMISDWLLGYIIFIASEFANLKFANINLRINPLIFSMMIIGLLLGQLFLRKINQKFKS